MRVLLFGQVQLGIGGMEVDRALGPVGEAGDGDLAEDRLQRAVVAGLDGGVGDAVAVDDTRAASLPPGAEVEMVLEELADEAPPVAIEPALELLMGEAGGIGAAEEGGQTVVEDLGRREGALGVGV